MKRIILLATVCMALLALLIPLSSCYSGSDSGTVYYTTVQHGYGYGPGWGGYGWGGPGYYPPGGVVVVGPPVGMPVAVHY